MPLKAGIHGTNVTWATWHSCLGTPDIWYPEAFQETEMCFRKDLHMYIESTAGRLFRRSTGRFVLTINSPCTLSQMSMKVLDNLVHCGPNNLVRDTQARATSKVNLLPYGRHHFKFVCRATGGVVRGDFWQSQQQPLSADDLWAQGYADCEADNCGLVPDGAIVLVINLVKLSH